MRRRSPLRSRPQSESRPELARNAERRRKRANGMCEVGWNEDCGQVGTEAHHRKPRGRGGSDHVANLVWCCLPCHSNIHANPDEAHERGWLLHSWDEEPKR